MLSNQIWVLVYIGVPDDFFYGSLHWADVTFPPFSSLCTQFYSSLSHGTTDCCWRRRIFAMGKFRSFCALLTVCEFVMCCYTSQGIGRKLIGIQLLALYCSLTLLHRLALPRLSCAHKKKKRMTCADFFIFCFFFANRTDRLQCTCIAMGPTCKPGFSLIKCTSAGRGSGVWVVWSLTFSVLIWDTFDLDM